MLVVNGEYCGIGYMLANNTAAGFSISNHNCATSNNTFAHELGHNMGSAHDRQNQSSGYYSYSFGHRFFGTNGAQYRTIMAYSPGTRIMHFSNPEVSFQGTPTGVRNSEDNALSLNNTATIVAAFRSGSSGECLQAAPTVSLSPSRQSIGAGAGTSYTLTVRNNDSSSCSSSSFSLSSAIPSGIGGVLSSQSLTISPGSSASAGLTISSTSSTAAGSYTFSLAAARSSQSSAVQGVVEVLGPDAVAPTAPTNLKAASRQRGAVSLSWNASTDNVGVAGYRVFQDGVQIASTSSRSFNISGLVSRQVYGFHVIAVDAAGNISINSNIARVTVK